MRQGKASMHTRPTPCWPTAHFPLRLILSHSISSKMPLLSPAFAHHCCSLSPPSKKGQILITNLDTYVSIFVARVCFFWQSNTCLLLSSARTQPNWLTLVSPTADPTPPPSPNPWLVGATPCLAVTTIDRRSGASQTIPLSTLPLLSSASCPLHPTPTVEPRSFRGSTTWAAVTLLVHVPINPRFIRIHVINNTCAN